jgi:hypothetical protein
MTSKPSGHATSIGATQRNSFEVSLVQMFDLSPVALATLVSALRDRQLHLPAENPVLEIPPGLSPSRLRSYQRDLVDYSEEGVLALRQRLAGMTGEDAKTKQTRATLARRIGLAPALLEQAQVRLETIDEANSRRERNFRHWMGSAGMPQDWINFLWSALRPEVTFARVMVTQSDKIGTLYVEREDG